MVETFNEEAGVIRCVAGRMSPKEDGEGGLEIIVHGGAKEVIIEREHLTEKGDAVHCKGGI